MAEEHANIKVGIYGLALNPKRWKFGWPPAKQQVGGKKICFEVKMLKSSGSQSTFLKFRCQKIARSCWGEAHFKVKMYKTRQLRTTFKS